MKLTSNCSPGSRNTSTRPVLRGLATILFLLAVYQPAPAAATVIDHVVEVSLQTGDGDIQIHDRVRVTGREQFRFQLADWFTRVEARIDDRELQLRREGSDYVIDLPDAATHTIDFDLRGRVPARNDATASDAGSSSGEDGVYLPAYDDWIPQPRGAPLRYRLEVTVAASQRAVATAGLVDESVGGGFYRASFVAPQAVEPPSLFAGPYEVQERLSRGLRLRTYFHAGLGAEAAVYLDAADAYIERYQQIIGAYPYADFDIVSAPLAVGLGFPGLTYIDRRIVPLPFMRTRSLAHEVLHNWWGNGVTVDYASGNWAEGLTTYMADYALERDKGEAAARAMRVKWLRDYAALPAERDQPVRAFTSKLHQAAQVIGYNKVAFVFHMLTLEIGEPAFAAGLRLFWKENKYRTAGWQELQAAFESASGRELGWFFEQWLERSGAPRLSLGAHEVRRVEAGYRIRIEVLQPVAGYRFQLPVLLQTEAGSERREITVSATRTSVEWITPARPQYIHFDPDSDVFRRLQRNETPPILRDITLNPETVTLIAGDQAEFIDSARTLAARLMDTAARFLEPGQVRKPGQPLLLITSFDRLAEQLERLQLQTPAELPNTAHGAAAWTARLANNTPVLVVSAASAAELQALLRPLPHYAGQSFVLFDGGRALDRGLWPLARGALYRDLATGS
jgi:hypothetical protein